MSERDSSKAERLPPAPTALDQFRRLEAETLEEENTERGRFMDIRERLSHALSLLKNELLNKGIDVNVPIGDKALLWSERFQALRKVLKEAQFPDDWAVNRESNKMSPEEATAWNYQILNAALQDAFMETKSYLMHLGVVPVESTDETIQKELSEALR